VNKQWQIMSAPTLHTLGIAWGPTPELALEEAVKEGFLVADTWKWHEVREGFRIILHAEEKTV